MTYTLLKHCVGAMESPEELKEFDGFMCNHNVHLGSVVNCNAKSNSQETVINNSIDPMFGCMPDCRKLKQC